MVRRKRDGSLDYEDLGIKITRDVLWDLLNEIANGRSDYPRKLALKYGVSTEDVGHALVITHKILNEDENRPILYT